MADNLGSGAGQQVVSSLLIFHGVVLFLIAGWLCQGRVEHWLSKDCQSS